MGKDSKIEWTDHTFNPVVGCTKVSPACDHCYAEAWAKRTGQAKLWQGDRRRTSASNWNQPLKWDREAAAGGARKRVFCASLADVFDNAWDPQWRADLFRLIRDTPNLDWLVLTKRIGNAVKMIEQASDWDFDHGDRILCGQLWDWIKHDVPLPNVWLGATVVNQEEADRDIPKLLAMPAAKRFLSIEPMLGPVEFSNVTRRSDAVKQLGKCALAGIDWVIVGGESGHHARPLHPMWVRSIRDQCATTGVAFHFKQWGEWLPGCQSEAAAFNGDGAALHEWDDSPEGFSIHLPKKKAGRMLDGRTHDGFPA